MPRIHISTYKVVFFAETGIINIVKIFVGGHTLHEKCFIDYSGI